MSLVNSRSFCSASTFTGSREVMRVREGSLYATLNLAAVPSLAWRLRLAARLRWGGPGG